MNAIDRLLVTLERLKAHLDDVVSGRPTARDDLATTLHLLVSPNRGFDQINKAFSELGMSGPDMPSFSSNEIPRAEDGKHVALGIRAVQVRDDVPGRDIPLVPLSEMLNQECVYHDSGVWTTNPCVTWRDLITRSRNQFGAHVDDTPQAWLQTLRYFPAAEADIVTVLLWALGEALLDALSHKLAAAGIDIEAHTARKSIDGVAFESGTFFSMDPGVLNVSTVIMLVDHVARKRTILGGDIGGHPFILGFTEQQFVQMLGGPRGMSVEDLEAQFLFGSVGPNMNRAARRAARRRS